MHDRGESIEVGVLSDLSSFKLALSGPVDGGGWQCCVLERLVAVRRWNRTEYGVCRVDLRFSVVSTYIYSSASNTTRSPTDRPTSSLPADGWLMVSFDKEEKSMCSIRVGYRRGAGFWSVLPQAIKMR